MSEMTIEVHEAAYQRLLAFAGKARNEVRNPNITANEAIYIANRLKALETVAKRCKRDYESPLYNGRLAGSTYEWLCDILDAAREVEK